QGRKKRKSTTALVVRRPLEPPWFRVHHAADQPPRDPAGIFDRPATGTARPPRGAALRFQANCMPGRRRIAVTTQPPPRAQTVEPERLKTIRLRHKDRVRFFLNGLW